MTESLPRRRSPRYPIQIPFVHRPKNLAPLRAGVGWTRNLSEGGACVELAERLRPQMPLWVRLQTDRGSIELEARVTWTKEPDPSRGGILHGVVFTQTAPGQLLDLHSLLLSKGLGRQPRARLPFDVPVTCKVKGEDRAALRGRTRDLSRGGLLLRLPSVLPPGTMLEVTLDTLPGPLTIEGAVAWVAPPEARTPGGPIRHGLRITHPSWSTSVALGQLVTERV